jgi:5-(aminomethyl)-3-furanmethanol phosphate kinase
MPDPAHPDLVLKVGGSLLADPALYARVCAAIGDTARATRTLIVPGGGPFAELVRFMEQSFTLGDDLAHWLAIRAMDSHAELLQSRLPDAVLVESRTELATAFANDAIPILAPTRWLRLADPLPHSWDVTSDSIAAWIASELSTTRLVLVKALEGQPTALVDPYFARALRGDIEVLVVSAETFAKGGLRDREAALPRSAHSDHGSESRNELS